MSIRPTLALLAFSLLAGCTTSPGQPAKVIRVAPDLDLVMPAPASLGRPVEAAQLVTARYGGQSFVFESRIKATSRDFRFVGVDSFGRRAMTITWNDTGIHSEIAPWLPPQIRPDNILADMVMLYWPEAVVRNGLAAAGGQLLSGPDQRSVSVAGREVIRADYHPAHDDDPWTGSLTYRNLAWGYELEVQSAETKE